MATVITYEKYIRVHIRVYHMYAYVHMYTHVYIFNKDIFLHVILLAEIKFHKDPAVC